MLVFRLALGLDLVVLADFGDAFEQNVGLAVFPLSTEGLHALQKRRELHRVHVVGLSEVKCS